MGSAQGDVRDCFPVSARTDTDSQRLNRGDPDSYAFGKRLLVKPPDSLVGAGTGQCDEFVRLMGGQTICRKDLPVIIGTAEREGLGRYGEPLSEKVVGLIHGGVIVPSRFRTWIIKFNSSSGAGARDPPWRRPCNCSWLTGQLEFACVFLVEGLNVPYQYLEKGLRVPCPDLERKA